MVFLPCKRCGNSLAAVKGSIIQCSYCNTNNLYMESVFSHKNYVTEILNTISLKKKRKINNNEIERRKSLIKAYYQDLSFNFSEYRHLIITKLNDIEINPAKLFKLIRAAGNLEIIIEKYLLVYLDEDDTYRKFQKIRDLAYIINKSLLGLYYSYLAKKSIRLKDCHKYYLLAEKNFQNIVDYCKITKFEDHSYYLKKEEKLYSILVDFVIFLRKVLTENPRHFSKKLKNLLKELNQIEEKSIQISNLYSQIEQIYQLERDTHLVLEKVKVINPLVSIESFKENLIINTEKNLDKLNNFQNLINDVSKKYQKYQRKLLKLHSGQLIDYLEAYRTEFIDYKNKNIRKFDDLLDDMIRKAFEDYNLETIEVIDMLSDFIRIDIYNENIIQKFEIEREDLISRDELLKNFIDNLFKKPFLRNLESGYYKKLMSLISGKHTEFDIYISKYINRLLKDFEDFRNRNIPSIEEQRNQFSSKLKPDLQKLVDVSFTLNEEYVPYPLFIDIDTQNQNFTVNNPDILTLLIENPNLTDIKNIKIYFFMPNSFQSKLKFLSLDKLKANERRKYKIKIIPKEKGIFPFMVMIEYQHSNKTFWMPSLKLRVIVENIIKTDYPKLQANDLYHNFLKTNENIQVFRFMRNLY